MAGFRSSRLQILLLLIFIASVPVLSAPYLNEAREDTQKQIPLDQFFQPSQGLIGPLFRKNDHSVHPPYEGACHYQLRYYEEGERIDTKEPCLNCTCHNSMLMCYLKVCPFSKPIGKECTVEKSPDQCCPVITCPQVPVNLQVMHMAPWTTTLSPVSSTAVAHHTEHGCSIEGQYYPDGAQVPGDVSKPCELCYCIRNHTACIMQECILKVEGCEPVFEDGICCPVRYLCSHEKELEQITTTTMDPNGTLITTTLLPPSSGGCLHDGEFYADGALIRSTDPCEHCYCMNSDVVCAIQECRSPLDEDDENCIPRPPPHGQCCPEAYDCPDVPETTTLKLEITERPSEVETTSEIHNQTRVPEIFKPVTEQVTVDETTPAEEEDEATTDSVPLITEDSEFDVTESPEDEKPVVETETTALDDVVELSTRPHVDEATRTSTIKSTDDSVISEIYQPEIEISTEYVSARPTLTEAPFETDDKIEEIETEPEKVDKPAPEPVDLEEGETFAIDLDKPDVSEIHEDPVDTDLSKMPEETTYSTPIKAPTTPEIQEIVETDEPKRPEDLTTSGPVSALDITEDPDEMDVSTTDKPDAVYPDKMPPKELEDEIVDSKYPDEIKSTTADYEESKTTALPIDTIESETKLPEMLPTVTEATEEQAEDITTLKPLVDYDDLTSPFTDVLVTEEPSISPDTSAKPEIAEDKTPSTEDGYEETDTTLRPELPDETQTDGPPKLLETTLTPEEEETFQDLDSETSTDIPAPVHDHETTLSPEEETSSEVDSVAITDIPTLEPSYEPTLSPVEEETSPEVDTEAITDTPALPPSYETTLSPAEETYPEVDAEIVSDAPTQATPYEPTLPPEEEASPAITDKPASAPSHDLTPTPEEEIFPEIDSEAITDIPSHELALTPEETFPEMEPETITDTPAREPSHEVSPSTEEETAPEVDSETITDMKPISTEASTTTSDYDEIILSAPPRPSAGACNANGTLYQNGQNVPVLNQCQEECHCKNSVITCQFRACPSPPPIFLRCNIRQEQEDCCPQYECPVYEAAEEPSQNCARDGIQYQEGDFVPSKDLCTDCYCLYGDIVCAYQECPEYSEGCKPLETPKGSCCPTKYECPELEVGDMTVEMEDKEIKPTDSPTEVATTAQTEEAEALESTEKPSVDEQTPEPSVSPIDYDHTKRPTIQPVDKEPTTTTVSLVPEPQVTEEQIAVTDEVIETTSEAITGTQPQEEIEQDISTSHPETVTEEADAEAEDFTIQTPVVTEGIEPVDEEETHTESVTDDYAVESTTQLEKDIEMTPEATTKVSEIVTEKIHTDIEELTTPPELITESDIEKEEEGVTSLPEAPAEIEPTKETTHEELTTEPISVTEKIDAVTKVTTIQPEIITEKLELVDHTAVTQPDETTDEVDLLEVSTIYPEDSLPAEEVTTQPQITVEEEEKEITPEVTTAESEIGTVYPDFTTEISMLKPDHVTEEIETVDKPIKPEAEDKPSKETVPTTEPEVITEKVYEVDETSTMQPDSVTEYAEVVTEEPEAEITMRPEMVAEVTDPSIEHLTAKPEPSIDIDSEISTVHPEEVTEEVELLPETSSAHPGIVTEEVELLPETSSAHPEIVTEEVELLPETSSAHPEIVTEELEIVEDTTPVQPKPITEEMLTEKPYDDIEIETSTKYPAPYDLKPTDYEIEESTSMSPEVSDKEIEDDFPEELEPSTSRYPEDITTKLPVDYEVVELEIQPTEKPESSDTTPSAIEITDGPIPETEKPVVSTKAPHLQTSYLPPELTTEEAVSVTSTESDLGIPGEGNCLLNNTEYRNGDDVPTSSQCQEKCTCKDSVITCQLKACPAPPPVFLRCDVTEQTDECCPSYECPVVEPSLETSPECKRDDVQYYEGDYVPSKDICTDCYCLYGKIVCATLECPPMPKGCIRADLSTESCCPTKYECFEQEPESDTTTATSLEAITDEHVEQVTEPEPGLQTELPVEDKTEKSTTIDDSSLYETETTKPEDPHIDTVEEVTTGAPTEELSTQLYTDEPESSTSDKFVTEVSEEIQKIETTEVPTVDTTSSLSTERPEVSQQQESSTEFTTEILELQPEVQTTPTDVHTSMAVDAEIQTEAETEKPTEEEFVPVTSSILEQDSTEPVTESLVETATGKYTSESDVSTVAYELTSELVTDKPTTEKTIVEPIDTEEESLTELPTTVTSDIETTTASEYERPIDKPVKETPLEIIPEKEVVEEKPKEEPFEKSCLWSNNTYEHGASVPPESECQDFCKCDNGVVKCKHRACPPVPPSFLRCATSSSNDTCCPTYECGESEPSPQFCLHEGMIYNNGDYIASGTECLDCYCLDGEVVCASLECGVPRADCKALVQRDSDCCPILYECSESPMESEEFMISPEDATEIDIGSSTPSVSTTKPIILTTPDEDATESPIEDLATEPHVELSTVKTSPTEESLVTEAVQPESETTEELVTDRPDEITDISGETTIKPVEISDHEVTIKTEEIMVTDEEGIEMDDTLTTPSELLEQPSEKTPDDHTTETTIKEILTTESAIEDTTISKAIAVSSISTDEPSVTSVPSVLETSQEPLTEVPEDVEITEEPTIKPEEIMVTHEEDKEIDATSTTTRQPTTTAIPKEIPDDDTSLSPTEELLTTLPTISTTEEPVKKPSISAVESPEESKIEKPEDHKIEEEEPEPPFPPFPEDSPKEPFAGMPEDDITDKETRPERPFSPFPPFPGDISETPAEMPEDELPEIETMPEIALPPEISDMYGQTYLPPHIMNETTTWKPSTTTELVIGPGHCLFDRKVYASAEQIPRDDPCDFCFCFRGDIICLQQTCPDPIDGCYEEAIPGFCCPRYECPVRQEIVNITTTTPSPIPGFPPIQKTSRVAMCEIEGKHYASGEVVKSASSPCHECICGTDGFMKCIPKECDTKRKIYKYGYR